MFINYCNWNWFGLLKIKLTTNWVLSVEFYGLKVQILRLKSTDVLFSQRVSNINKMPHAVKINNLLTFEYISVCVWLMCCWNPNVYHYCNLNFYVCSFEFERFIFWKKRVPRYFVANSSQIRSRAEPSIKHQPFDSFNEGFCLAGQNGLPTTSNESYRNGDKSFPSNFKREKT